MDKIKTSKDIDYRRRRFVGTAALTVAAAQLGMIGVVDAQPGKVKLPPRSVAAVIMPSLVPTDLQVTGAIVIQCESFGKLARETFAQPMIFLILVSL